jgi:hypothetical protein
VKDVAYRFDIDGTIAFPHPDLYDPDFQRCAQNYVAAGLVTQEDIATIPRHTTLFLLPSVAATHIPAPGVVEILHQLAALGVSFRYHTARNSVNSEQCTAIHAMTHEWLRVHGFPAYEKVSFVSDITHKLLYALDAREQSLLLVDDRIADLLKAYRRIAAENPARAQEIRERVVLVSFRKPALQEKDAPRTVFLKDWSGFFALVSSLS